MKKIMLITMSLLMIVQLASAQNCSQFINALNGKKLTYSNQNAKGKEQGKLIYTTTKKNAATITVHSEVSGKDGKTISGGDSEIMCDGGIIKIDMKAFIPAASMKQYGNMQMSGEAKYLTYPVNLTVGQTLENGSITINMGNGGAQISAMQMDIINRKVEATETIATGAGSFDCLKITYDATIKVKTMGIGIPFHMKVIEWYAPQIGRFVKSETHNKSDKLMGSTVLESIN